MAEAPIPPWTFGCPWCEFSILVFARGGPYGAGEEAADRMQHHLRDHHPGRTWTELLAATSK